MVLGEVLGDQLGHFKHVDDCFAVEDLFEGRIGVDVALVGSILKTILLDVSP